MSSIQLFAESYLQRDSNRFKNRPSGPGVQYSHFSLVEKEFSLDNKYNLTNILRRLARKILEFFIEISETFLY